MSYLRVMAATWCEEKREDAELIARFAGVRDEGAFAVLVWRHGALVWRTCRRILGDTPDAEDAFQTTFLALARKAGRFPVKSLVGWLHQTARRAALDAQASARRRRSLEQRVGTVKQPEAEERDAVPAELYAALDEELAGLPERLRVPLLLHYLEGRSQVEVARLLGCGRSVLQRRLARGEAILRKRLQRRGLTVGIGSMAALLGASTAASAVPGGLIGITVRAVLRSLSFSPLEPSKAAALAEGVMKTMLVTKMKIVMVLLGVTLCLAGGGLLAYQALAGNTEEPLQPASEPRGEAEASRQPGAAARVDCYGDPLPEGALARLGTTRLYHGGRVNSVAFSPDDKTVAAGGGDGTVRLWKVATGKKIRTMKGNQKLVWSVAFSSDGKAVASGGHDGTVRLWEAATGKLIRTLQGHKVGNFISVAFSPDGKAVASGGEYGAVRLWEAATGKEIRTLKGHKGMVWSLAFSPDGKAVASGGEDGTVRLWETATGKLIRTLQQEYKERDFISVAFSPDGKVVASGGNKVVALGGGERGERGGGATVGGGHWQGDPHPEGVRKPGGSRTGG